MMIRGSANPAGTKDCDFAELIRKIRSGDDKAFKEIFYLMQPGIFRFVYRYINNSCIAEDLTQETFIKFWVIRNNLDETKSPKAYLYRIARNLALNHITRQQPKQSYSISKNDYLSLIMDPVDNYDKYFLMDDFQRAVNDLPERCKATFVLSRYEGCEYSEIAEILHVSLQTVKNQMNKAIAVLRKRLASHLS